MGPPVPATKREPATRQTERTCAEASRLKAYESLRNLLLPVVHGSIELAVHGEVGPLIRELCCEGFVHIDSQTGLFSGVHPSILEIIGVRKDLVCFRCVAHVFLDAEIMNAQVEMQRGRHAHGAQVGGAMRAGQHLIGFRQGGTLSGADRLSWPTVVRM